MIYHIYTWELGGSFQKYNQISTVSLLKLLSRSTSAIWSFEPIFHSSLSHWGTFSQVLLPCGFTIRSTRAFAALRRLNFRGSAIGHWTCKIKFTWNTGTEEIIIWQNQLIHYNWSVLKTNPPSFQKTKPGVGSNLQSAWDQGLLEPLQA